MELIFHLIRRDLRQPLIGSKSWSTSKSVKVLTHIGQMKEARFVDTKSSVSILRRMWSNLYLITFTITWNDVEMTSK